METSSLAHGIHYAIVAAGVVGILALLVPQALERRLGARSAASRSPRDPHEARVLQLRAEIAGGTLGAPRPAALAVAEPEPVLPVADRLLLPLAFVASTAAAGVHAAMAPSHLEHRALFGVFFVAAAFAQLAWAALAVVAVPRALLVAGVAGNVAVTVLWAVTRTVGLPVLMPQPEAVGPWDVTCVAWQLVVVVACVRLLSSPTPPARLPAWHRWDGRAVLLTVVSAAALAALSFGGFSG